MKKTLRLIFVFLIIIVSITLFACKQDKVVISDEPYFDGNEIIESGETYEEEPEGNIDTTNIFESKNQNKKNKLYTIEPKNITENDEKNEYIVINYEVINIDESYFSDDKNLRSEIKKYNNDKEKIVKEFDGMLEDVQELFKNNEGFPATYEYNSTINVERMDQQIFSFSDEIYMFTAGAHGSTSISNFNYSISDRKIVNLSDVVSDKKKMLSIIKKYLEKHEDDLFPDYLETITEDYDYNFLVTEDGIDIIFGQYEIAPYSTGFITISINKDIDEDVLNLKYFS